jgi:hypothetical protein
LKCAGKQEKDERMKHSLYDMGVPQNRKGFSGWKLTKRPQELIPVPEPRAQSRGTRRRVVNRNKRYASNDPYASAKMSSLKQPSLGYNATRMGDSITNIEVGARTAAQYYGSRD